MRARCGRPWIKTFSGRQADPVVSRVILRVFGWAGLEGPPVNSQGWDACKNSPAGCPEARLVTIEQPPSFVAYFPAARA